jgi:5'-3' exonuclease
MKESDKFTEDEVYSFWKNSLLNTILATIRKFNPDDVVFAIDYKESWRKIIYPQYKQNRKAEREKSFIDFSKFYRVMEDFLSGMEKSFTNFFFIKANSAEADDVIAILVNYRFQNFKSIIVSSDSDLVQLMQNKNVSIFNPVKKANVEVIDPNKKLQIKILSGDSGDNIKPIRKGIGEKTAEKILREDLHKFLEESGLEEQYELNCKLIDFQYIPNEIMENVLNIYDKYSKKELDGKVVCNWLLKNGLVDVFDNWQTLGAPLKNIC